MLRDAYGYVVLAGPPAGPVVVDPPAGMSKSHWQAPEASRNGDVQLLVVLGIGNFKCAEPPPWAVRVILSPGFNRTGLSAVAPTVC